MVWELMLLGLAGGIIGLIWVLIMSLWDDTEQHPQLGKKVQLDDGDGSKAA